MKRVREMVGVAHVTDQRWVRWYEAGGYRGSGEASVGQWGKPYETWTPAQEQRLREAVSEGRFRTIGEAMACCEKELGVAVSYKKLYDRFRRWGYRKKVPRPMAAKADVQAQEGWKKGGYWQPCRRRG